MANEDQGKQPDVTPDNFLEHPNTPPDMLDSAVKSGLTIADSHHDESKRDKLRQAISHPNTSTETLTHAYSSLAPNTDEAAAQAGLDEPAHTDLIEHILKHPNASPNIAQDYLKRTYKNPAYIIQEAQDAARANKGVPEEFKEGLLQNLLTDDMVDAEKGKRSFIDFKLHPDVYYHLLEKRPTPEPVTARMTESQKKKNNYVKKIDAAVLSGLATSDKHDKQSLERAVAFYSSPKPPYGMDEGERNKSLQTFLYKQKDLTPESLNQLNELKQDDGKDDWHTRSNILDHPNVDPMLVAKVALSSSTPGNTDKDGKWAAEQAIEKAVSSPKLPEQTRKSIIGSVKPDSPSDEQKVSALLENPTTTKEDLMYLYQNGFADAVIKDSRLPDEVVNHYAEGNGTTTQGARKLLQRDRLPEAALTQLVNNKNQNVAVDALNHKDVTLNVINTALKRKAEDVQMAASRHPLVARQVLRDKLRSGKLSAADILFDEDTRKAMGPLTPEDIAFINHKHSISSPDQAMAHNEDVDFWKTKNFLANSDEVPASMRDKNGKDLVDHFLRSNEPFDMIPAFRPGDHDVKHRLAKYVARLAEVKGNDYAKNAALQRPYLLHQLNLDNPTYDESYLRSAYMKMKTYEQAGLPAREGVTDHEGGDRFFLKNKAKMSKNPSLSEDVFDDLYHNGQNEYLKTPSNYMNVDKEGNDTVFDKRWGDLPEDLKRERFAKLQAIHDGDMPRGYTDSKFALISSKKAPKDMWRASFQGLDNEGRKKFLENHDISEYADPETKRDILSGNYLNAPEGRGATGLAAKQNAVDQVLRSLDPSKSQDLDDLNHFLNTYVYPTSEDERLDNSDIAKHIDKGFITSPEYGHQLLAGVFANNPGLASRMAHEASTQKYTPDDDEFMNLMQAGTETMFPDEKKLVMQNRWLAALNENNFNYDRNASSANKSILVHHIGDSTDDPNGKLDFLADGNDSIREKAMAQGLISHARMATEIAKTPDEINSIIRQSGAYEGARRIQEIVDVHSMSPEVLKAVIPLLNDSSFSARRIGREAMTDMEFSKVRDYTYKLLNHTLASYLPEKDTAEAINNLLTRRSDKGDHGALNMDKKKELARSIISHIETSNIFETDKNKVLMDLSDKMEGSGILPSDLKKNVIKRAIATKDVEAIARAAQNPDNLPREAANAIMEAFNEPDSFTNNQIAALMKVASRQDIQTGSVRRAFDVLNDRANKAAEAGDKTEYAAICLSIVRAARDGMSSFHSRDMEGSKGQFYIQTMMDFARSDRPGNVEAQNFLLNTLHMHSTVVPEIFSELPDGLDLKSLDGSDYLPSQMSIANVNDPKVIGSALSGWKLNCIVKQSYKLNKESADVIANRVLNSDIPYQTKVDFAAGLMSSEFQIDPSTVISAMRANGEDTVFDVVNHKLLASDRDADWSSSNLHVALPLMNSTIERHLDQESGVYPDGTPFVKMDEKNLHRVFDQLETASSVFKTNITGFRARPKRDGTVGQIVDDELHHFTNNVGKAFQNAVEGINAGRVNPEGLSDLARSFKVISDNVCNGRGQVSSTNALGAIELTTYADRLAEAAKEKFGQDFDTSHLSSSPERKSRELRGIMTNTGFDKESWDKALSIQPACAAALGFKKSIPAYMAEAIDWNSFGDNANSILSEWIPNLDQDAKPKIIPKILDHVTSRYVASKDWSSGVFLHTVKTAIQQAPEAISSDYMHTLSALIDKGQFKEAVLYDAIENGAGGPDYCRSQIDKGLKKLESGHVAVAHQQSMAMCPHITSDQVEKLVAQEGYPDHAVIEELSANKQLDQRSVSKVVNLLNSMPSGYASESVLGRLVAHPAISKEDYLSLGGQMTLGNPQQKRAYFSNARWGGEAFRKLPVSLPNLGGIRDKTHVTVKEADYSVPRERLNALLPVIPAQGIDWATFKRANKSMENLPEVKGLFMSKKGNIVTPEDVVSAIKSSDDPFHVTYSTWDGAQRHTKENNLVIQLNLSDKMEKDLSSDPLQWEFYNALTNAMMGGHPATPRIAGWVRVDTSGGKKGWIAEEFQSDFDSIEDWTSQIVSTGNMLLNGKPVTEDQINGYCKNIKQRIKNWHMAGMKAFEELAKKHGTKAIYIHGAGLRSSMSGFDSGRENPVRVTEMYDKIPQKLGWDKVDYSDYPHQGGLGETVQDEGRSSHAWKKTLKA